MASVQDIYNEIDRIENAKSGIAEAIEEKGVEVPEGTMIQDFPEKVRQIQQGSTGAVLFTPQELTSEQQAQARDNIGAGTYTKPNTGIPATDFAQGVQASLEKANTAVQPAALTPITELIPEQATPQNQLADKNFVNSSVATNTANYISDNGQPFQSVADLEAYTGPLTNNDYAFVVGTDSAGNTTYTRYKYNATTQTWAAEYVLNNSSFTAEQWAAISSGITALLVQKLSELPTEIVTYVAQTLTEAQKQQARQNIGATAPEIFWVEYSVTPFDDIVNAYNAGKFVLMDYNNIQYILTNVSTAQVAFSATSGNDASMRWITLTKATGRWTGSSYVVELRGNKSQSIETDRASTTKYPSVKAVFDSLFKWGIVSQTQTWTGSNATGWSYTMSNQMYGMIPRANIDLYEAAGAVFNESTGYFELNELTDISYNEMKDIYANSIGGVQVQYDRQLQFSRYNYRTTLPLKFNYQYGSNLNNMFTSANYIEVINLKADVNERVGATRQNFGGTFAWCYRLKKILGILNEYASTGLWQPFGSCVSLESVKIFNLNTDISINNSPNLSLESVNYMVSNAGNTIAITITLHATAYARMQADTTEYEYNGQTYVGIIAYAAARNISIVSA